MPKKTAYQHRWGLDPIRIDPEKVEAAVRVPGELGFRLNAEQEKRWRQLVGHIAWRLEHGAGPSQAAVDEMLKEIEAGVEQMLPALETIQNPMIKREFAFKPPAGTKMLPLPPHLQARNISTLIDTLKEWKLTCRVELGYRTQHRKKGRTRDKMLDSAILVLGVFYKEVTGKNPTVYRWEKTGVAGSRPFGGEFLELALETLLALDLPGITEAARNALAERIERLKPVLVA
jgi:hypothetical protein